MQVLKRLWNDESGAIISIELVLVATIAVIGLVVGLATLRDAVTNELGDVAGAVDDVNQSYIVNGILGHSAAITGSDFDDNEDFCDNPDDPVANAADQCIVHNVGAVEEADGPTQPVPN